MVMGEASPGTLLRIYLRDHLAGAVVGIELARRCLNNNRGTELEPVLEDLLRQITEDRGSLLAIMDHFRVTPSQVKMGLAVVAERVGRAKLNGQLTGYSRLSRLVELEGLAAGVETKRKLWQALQATVPPQRLPDGIDLDDLAERARRQHDTLEEQRRLAAKAAFGAAFAPA